MLFFISVYADAVLAAFNYSTSRSNRGSIIELGVDEEDVDKIFDAFEKEVKARENLANTLLDFGDVEFSELRRVLGYGSMSSLRSLEGLVEKIERPGRGKIKIEIEADRDQRRLLNAMIDYREARLETVEVIREAGIKKEADIEKILKILYEPVLAADAVYDAVNRAMSDFPFLARIFGEERMNVYVKGLEPFSIVTRNGRVKELRPGGLDDPTMKVYTSLETVKKLGLGEITPVDAVMQGNIRYEGVGFAKSLKFKVLGFAAKMVKKVVRFKAGADLA